MNDLDRVIIQLTAKRDRQRDALAATNAHIETLKRLSVDVPPPPTPLEEAIAREAEAAPPPKKGGR